MINYCQTIPVYPMDIKEKFQHFDAKLESIDGLSTDMKTGLSALARAVVEAETGEAVPAAEAPAVAEPAPTEPAPTDDNDLASVVGLDKLVDTFNAALDPDNPTPLPADFKQTAMNVALDIDQLARGITPNDNLSKLPFERAKQLTSSLPDPQLRINDLEAENREIHSQVAGAFASVSPEEMSSMRETIEKNRAEISNLKTLKKILADIRGAISRYESRINDASYTQKKSRVTQMMIDQYQRNQGTNVAPKTVEKITDNRKSTPEELIERAQSIVGACKHYANDISALMLAIQDHNKAIRGGASKSTVQFWLNKRHKKVDKSLFVTDSDGGALFRVGQDIAIPLRAAYEMSLDGVKIISSYKQGSFDEDGDYNDGNDQIVIAEDFHHNGKTYADWMIVLDIHGTRVIVSVANIKDGKPTANENVPSVEVWANPAYKVLTEAFQMLNQTIQRIIPLRSAAYRH